jgi:hypothetical protein
MHIYHVSITLRLVHVTNVAVEKQEGLHILSVYSLSHRARKAHAPFILSSVACLALTYFSTLSHKRQDAFIWYSLLLFSFWNISHSTENSARYYYKRTQVFVKWPLFLSYFNRTWVFSTHFPNILKYIKLKENPSSGSRDVPCGRTDERRNMIKLTFVFFTIS